MHQPLPDPKNITPGSDQLAVAERNDNRVLPPAIRVFSDSSAGERVFDPPSATVARPHAKHHTDARSASYAFVARKAVNGACAMKSSQKGLFRSTGSSIASTQ